MPLKGTKNQGVLVFIGTQATDPSGDTFTQIGRVDTIGEFGAEAPIIDVTALEDTSREKIKGIPDAGDIDLGIKRVVGNAGQELLIAAGNTNTDVPHNFRIELDDLPSGGSNPTSWSFKALVTKAKTSVGDIDGVIMLEGTLAVTGSITDAVAA